MIRRSLAAAGIAMALAASVAWAQNPPVRVRGTIDKVDGDTLMVKSRDGTELTIVLAPDAKAAAIVKASLADIKQGGYVGVTGMPQPDGSQKAVEVHIFPEALRGLGEGHRPWDLLPQSTMTNANVEQAVTAADGQTLTLKYKDGEKKVIVPTDAQIVAFAPGDRGELKPGVKIFAVAEKQPDGSLKAARVNYGKDGLTPPM
jgi:outer membrane lipoprotein SlyB